MVPTLDYSSTTSIQHSAPKSYPYDLTYSYSGGPHSRIESATYNRHTANYNCGIDAQTSGQNKMDQNTFRAASDSRVQFLLNRSLLHHPISRTAGDVNSNTPRTVESARWHLQNEPLIDLNTPINQPYVGNGASTEYSPTPAQCQTRDFLEDTYAYCYYRGNGVYTRLIPADMLPSLSGIPPQQHSSAGMLVLPIPSAEPPTGPSSNTNRVMLKVSKHIHSLFKLENTTH
jgi:hypothetical protein